MGSSKAHGKTRTPKCSRRPLHVAKRCNRRVILLGGGALTGACAARVENNGGVSCPGAGKEGEAVEIPRRGRKGGTRRRCTGMLQHGQAALKEVCCGIVGAGTGIGATYGLNSSPNTFPTKRKKYLLVLIIRTLP